ncbi:MAG: bifunctional diguanylate cyclase/phosphodiesterase [Helicobacteraceae bacterium]|nr:bifunctional diguanylate cyclase/phosphodiesterase [Helicobacteraceae bacterium]
MNPLRLIFIIVLIALISAFLLVKFYITQRNFTAHHKEFTLALNTFESQELQLKHALLENALSAYQNMDPIAQHVNALLETHHQLLASKILEDENYKELKNKLKELKKTLDIRLAGVEDQLMLNAGIRNSLIFLSTQVYNLNLHSEENIQLYAQAHKILKRFNDTALTQDLDYLTKEDHTLHTTSKQKNIQDFVDHFNLHAKYLIKNFPQFIITTKYVLNNNLSDSISTIKELFRTKALSDFRALDLFALLIFTIFTSSVIVIIFLTTKYFRENKKLRETTHSLEYSLSHDQLTGFLNRNSFSKELTRLARPHLLLLNIDEFKNVNDIYGNNVGNRLIKSLTKFIEHSLKEIEYINIYRTGGDEFGILFENIEPQKALDVAHKLQKQISEHTFVFNHLDIEISVSIASNNIRPIIENADLALKLVKKDLTRRVIAFNEDLNLKKSVKENLKTIDMIKHAIQEDRVIPYFQPIINLAESKIEKYEALVRVQLKNGTIISPFVFLDIIKKTSYYQDITAIMLEKTVDMAKQYPQYRFSVNISMIDILNEEIRNMLLEKLTQNFATASRIDIEILESEHVHDIAKVKEFINELHKTGAHVLLDDFGTGYSNFSYFSDLDIDLVKIDGSIVKEIVQDERKSHMLQSIFDFSQGLKLDNVAEFVETQEIAQMLQKMGVKYAQGYYFGKPAAKPLDNENVHF